MGKVCVVVPARNEAPRISAVLRDLRGVLADLGPFEVIVVDDASADATAAVAEAEGAIVLQHQSRRGLGAALRTGTEAGLRRGAEVVVHLDGDGQHDPADLRGLLAALEPNVDYVAGRRAFRAPMPALFIFGNQVLSLLTWLLFGAWNPDTQCGYRAFRAGAYERLRWTADDYAEASEIVVRVRANRLVARLLPVRTIYLDRYKGTGVRDGFRILAQLLRWRFGGL